MVRSQVLKNSDRVCFEGDGLQAVRRGRKINAVFRPLHDWLGLDQSLPRVSTKSFNLPSLSRCSPLPPESNGGNLNRRRCFAIAEARNRPKESRFCLPLQGRLRQIWDLTPDKEQARKPYGLRAVRWTVWD